MADLDAMKKAVINPEADNEQIKPEVKPATGEPAKDAAAGDDWRNQKLQEPLAGKYQTFTEAEKALKEKDSAYSKRDERAKQLEGFFELVGQGNVDNGITATQQALETVFGLRSNPVKVLQENPDLFNAIKQAVGSIDPGLSQNSEDFTQNLLNPEKSKRTVLDMVKAEVAPIKQENEMFRRLLNNLVNTQTLREQNKEEFDKFSARISQLVNSRMAGDPQTALIMARGEHYTPERLKEIIQTETQKAIDHTIANYDFASGKFRDKPAQASSGMASLASEVQSQLEQMKQNVINPEGTREPIDDWLAGKK